jgi:hypothetical protein
MLRGKRKNGVKKKTNDRRKVISQPQHAVKAEKKQPYHTHTNPEPVKPGEIYEFAIELMQCKCFQSRTLHRGSDKEYKISFRIPYTLHHTSVVTICQWAEP